MLIGWVKEKKKTATGNNRDVGRRGLEIPAINHDSLSVHLSVVLVAVGGNIFEIHPQAIKL